MTPLKFMIDRGKVIKSDSSLELSSTDFGELVESKITGRDLFIKGKLKIKGNMTKAMALDDLLKYLYHINIKSKY